MKRHYWTVKTESAIIQYIQTDDQLTKNRIFEKSLYTPFTKVVEALINSSRYSTLDLQFKEEISTDCIVFLWQQIEKFNPAKSSKALSYFTQISKNFILQSVQNRAKSYQPEDVETLFNSPDNDEIEDKEELELTLTKIESAIKNLNLYETKIYEMYYVKGMTMKEIAQKIGISSYPIYKIIKDIKEKVKSQLNDI